MADQTVVVNAESIDAIVGNVTIRSRGALCYTEVLIDGVPQEISSLKLEMTKGELAKLTIERRVDVVDEMPK